MGDQLNDRGRAWNSIGASLLAVAVTATACGGASSSPSAPTTSTSPGTGTSPGAPPTTGGTATACRTYATAATATTTFPSGVAQMQSLTGSFDAATNRTTVTTLLNGSPCSVTISSYGSRADFVDEVRVVPGVTLVMTAVTTTSAACGSTSNTVTFSYDGQRRLTQFATSPGGTTAYTAWDSSGRPTSGTAGPTILISNAYDDAARTLTQTQTNGGMRTVNTQSFDANGIQTRVVVADATGTPMSTTVFATTATAQICK